MSVTVPEPTLGRVVSILWFPFFLAVAMSTLFVVPLAAPTPDDMRIGVAGGPASVDEVRTLLDEALPGGFLVHGLAPDEAAEAVRANRVAAAIVTGADPQVLVASAASATRAGFLEELLPTVVEAPVQDIAPSAPGDATGTGVFFYALPIAIVAMVSAIVLLQLGAWSYRRKMLAVTIVAAFTAVVTYAIAVWQQVLPLTGDSALLMLGTFAFVQAIGWTLTGAAHFVRQFLVPVALTFVLVLGVPTAGAPVSADMLPGVLAGLHRIMPMGQFIALVRSLAYAVGSPLYPSIVLLAWLVVGAALIALAGRRLRHARHAEPAGPADPAVLHDLHGTVTSLSGRAVPHALVRVFDADGESMLRSETTADGAYALSAVPEGVHHILVTAGHAQPEIVTVRVHGDDERRHDVTLQLWDDPAGNLTAEHLGERHQD